MLVAAAPPPPLRNEHAFAGVREVRETLASGGIHHDRAHGDIEDHVIAGFAGALRAFAVAPAIRAEEAIEAVAQQSVLMLGGDEPDAAAISAVAAGRAAARNILLAAERDAAVSAVAGLHYDFGFVNKHGDSHFLRDQIICAEKTKAALKVQDRRKTFSVSRKSQRC
jgi:hypothetical protein